MPFDLFRSVSLQLNELGPMGERRRKTRLKASVTRRPHRTIPSTLTTKLNMSSLCSAPSSPLTTSLPSLISIGLLLIVSICTLCNANEDTRFALRPFQASPQLTRRQDGHLHPIPVLDLPPVTRHEPNLVPILTAPVPRGSVGPKPSFQRIRLNKPSSPPLQQPPRQAQSHPPLPPPGFTPAHFTPSESPLTNFQRIAGFSPPLQPQVIARPHTVPIQPQFQPIGHPSLPPDAPQRQSFRRIKPSSGGTRRIKIKTSSPLPLTVINPSRPVELNSRRVSNSVTPELPPNSQRLRGRGPVTAQDEDLLHKDNALDNEDENGINSESSSYFGNRVTSSESAGAGDNGILLIESLSRTPVTSSFAPVRTSAHQAQVHTPTIPLTYYTTYTYFTTVLRGPHTAMLSRELVSTTTQVRPIDRSIVTAIEFSEGYIQPSKTLVALGTKTKGQTTTIYNMASRVQVFNDDLYKVIYATRSKPTHIEHSSAVVSSPKVVISSRVSSRVSSSVHRIEPTRTLNRPSPQSRVVTPPPPISSLKLDELEKQPKKLLNKYTYYYTFIDGANTKYSTRLEESTTNFVGNLANIAPSLAPSLDSDGLLQILSTKSATMALGSRAHGRMTTVVNLALNNYLQFDNVRDSSQKIVPTQVASPTLQTQTQTPSPVSSSFEDSALLTSLADRPSELSSQMETPRLSSEVIKSSQLSSSPVSSRQLLTSSSVRTRPAISRRPIRVKVKPIRSKLATLSRFSSRVSITSSTSPLVEPSPSITAQVTSSSVPQSASPFSLAPSPSPSPIFIAPSSTELPLSPTAPTSQVLSTLSSESIVSTPSVTRKKVVYTVRGRPTSGTNRYFNRRPSSYLFQRSSVFVSSPVPESSSIELLSPIFSSSSVVPSSVLPTASFETVTSSPQATFSPSLSSSQIESSSTLSSSLPELFTSPVLKPSKSNKSRLVVLTRLAGALNKWNPLYASRIRVSSRKVLKSTGLFDLSSMQIEPTSRVETVFETTTHTVPFTLGSTTIFTTVEETNSRVITRVDEPTESSFISPSFEPESSVMHSSTVSLSKAPPASTISFETKTQLTTLTHFNTFYTLDSSIVTSSEQTLSSVFAVPKLAPVSSSVVVETSDIVTTSTLYSTYTYFATLFNGTQTMITPLEEVKTEYLTLREPVVITRTIMPSMESISSSPSLSASVQPTSISSIVPMPSMDLVEPSYVTETHSTHTTLTHFITLFSGTRTILSSIEEISPTVMTRTRVVIPTSASSSITPMKKSTTDSPMLSATVVEIASEPIFSSSSVQPVYTSSIGPSSSSSPSLIEPSEMFVATSSPSEATSSATISLESVLYNPEQVDRDMSSEMSVMVGPSTTLVNEEHSSSTTAIIEPGSVIELNDLLDGVQDAGQIGEAIKDIVNNLNRPETVPMEEEPTTPMSTDETTEPDTEAPAVTTMMEVTTLAPSFNPSPSSEKPTPSLNSVKNRFPVYIASKNLPKYYMTSSEDKNNMVIFSTQSEGNEPEPSVSTRYVTSIEKSIKTLTLTSTKVYYTRDSPLTITNILTTTLPPITYVSTIIGSKTILGTYNSITPTKTSSLETSSSTVIVTSSMPVPPTTRPRLYRPKNQEQPTLLKAKVTPFLNSRKPAKPNATNKTPTMSSPSVKNITLGMETELQLCNPACNLTNKEFCRESESGKYSCECRPGYIRRPSDNLCQEIKNYLVVVRVSKTAESEVTSTSTDNEAMQSYARVARRIGKADGIAGLQVLSVDRTTRSNSALVNLTIQLDHTMNVHDDLSKKLQPLGQVEKVVDFDECSSAIHNDCSARGRCINEPGSYRCQCLENFIDLDQSLPGRLCVSEVKSCDYCYGRGDCWRQQSSTVCRCHPMFIGRRCEINVLAILVPIVAILVIVAIVCFLYCSRKLRQRNRRFKNLAAYGPVAVIGGTLDRKAMLETSSESSDPQHRSSHYNSESNPASARGSMARRNGSRRESEPSLDRSLASYSATGSHYNSLPPQILIPRARPPYTLHPGQVYMW